MRQSKFKHQPSAGIILLVFLTCLCSCEKSAYDLIDSLEAGKWTQFTKTNSGLPQNLIWDLEVKGDDLWASFYGAGIGVLSKGKWTFFNEENSGLLSNYVNIMEFSGNGDLHLGTTLGYCVRKASGEWSYLVDNSVEQMNVTSVKLTSYGDFWIGTEGEGFYCDFGSGFYKYTFAGFENVNEIVEDSKGNVWLGTDGGLLKFNDQSGLVPFQGLPQGHVTELFCDSKGRLWVGIDGETEVFNISQAGTVSHLSLRNGELGNFIMDICEDSRGALWFATWFDGLIRYDGIIAHSFEKSNGFFEDEVNCVCPDQHGNLWVGLWSKGLLKYSLPIF